MSERSTARRRTVIISFISGKGGVGKTALTASVGKVLALMGYKVLLVDSDLITHGLTFLLGFNPKKAGFLEVYNNFKDFAKLYISGKKKEADKVVKEFRKAFEIGEVCEISKKLYFIQSTSKPSKKYSKQVSTEADEISRFFTYFIEDFVRSKEYDFILIDTQAGSVSMTRTVVSLSHKVVIVMEPDPISTYATENIIGELSDVLPRDSFYVINKLSVEEASAYEAIETFLKILRHLSPIPFDFEVRRAFMIRQIPVDEKKPSAFLFGIIRMLRDLTPEISESIDKFEKRIEQRVILPTKQKIRDIEEELDRLASIEIRIKSRLKELEERKNRWITFTEILTYSVGFLLALTMAYFLTIPLTEESVHLIISLIIGVLVILMAYAQRGLHRKKEEKEMQKLERKLALLKEKQSRLRHEYEAYRNLLITRAKELTLKLNEKNTV